MLVVILGFVSLKPVVHVAHRHNNAIPEISNGASLVVIVLVLAATTVASLIKVRRDPTARVHSGSVRGGTGSRDGPADQTA